MRRSYGRERIQFVVAPRHGDFNAPDGLAFESGFAALREGPPVLSAEIRIKALKPRPAAARENPVERRTLRIRDHRSFARHDSHQMMELRFNGREIGEDVRMIVFEIIENRDPRTVVHEFAPLVAEGRVVFVRFNDEGSGRVSEFGRFFTPAGEPPDEVARVQARFLQNPGEHRRGRGLPVRAGNGEHLAALEDVFAHPLRARGIGEPRIENGFEERIPAGNGISHDPEVGRKLKLLSAVALGNFDSVRGKRVAHRRVNILVAPGDAVACCARELRDAAHEGAADAENMNMHEWPLTQEIFSLKRIFAHPPESCVLPRRMLSIRDSLF